MPKRESKYGILLQDEVVSRWLRNVARGSPISAEVALRRLGRACELLKTDPKALLERARKDIMGFQDSLEDLVAQKFSANLSQSTIS